MLRKVSNPTEKLGSQHCNEFQANDRECGGSTARSLRLVCQLQLQPHQRGLQTSGGFIAKIEVSELIVGSLAGKWSLCVKNSIL